jgi:hypothetical protein
MPAIIIGSQFGRWTVIERIGRREKRSGSPLYFKCRCQCGREKAVAENSLSAGTSRSCGCARHATHHLSKHPLYPTWKTMRRRCKNPKCIDYPLYGGRGIQVCERWNDVRNFIEDMGKRPDSTSLDRIDNDGDYEPANCRWATTTQQRTNKRPRKPFSRGTELTAFGETLPVRAWEIKTGITCRAIYYRIARGWPAERVVSEPLRTTSRQAH